jgi:alpha-beta hydrolase superfamily lysophospholipase
MQSTTFTFKAANGPEIFVYRWAPDGGKKPKAALQVAHGASEHGLRYARLARRLTEAGYVVYADDHRGHGRTAVALDKAGIAGPDAWNGIICDMHQLSDGIRRENPGMPLIFFGHSLGSIIAQRYIQLWGGELKGAVLSGSFGALGADPAVLIPMCEQEARVNGDNASSQVFGGMFVGFNQPFQPAMTGFEWLSRDEAEVKKYVDDPWCGFPFSNRLAIDFFEGTGDVWSVESEARIPKALPLLVVSGELDPAGGNGISVNLLVDRYRAQGLKNIQLKFYPGARHEILNELNRDEVEQDILNWMDQRVD